MYCISRGMDINKGWCLNIILCFFTKQAHCFAIIIIPVFAFRADVCRRQLIMIVRHVMKNLIMEDSQFHCLGVKASEDTIYHWSTNCWSPGVDIFILLQNNVC